MAEEKTEAAGSAAAAPSAGGGNQKLVLILTGVNLLVTVGIIGLLFVSFQKEAKRPTVGDIAAGSEHGGGEGEKEGAKAEGGKEGEGAKGGEGHGGGKAKVSDFGKMVTLEQFTVNLSTPGTTTPKYVRVNISIEVPNGDVENEVGLKMPQVRNVVIDLFNSKRPADLGTAEGREYLKEEIKNALNTVLVSGKIKGVFFTNFTLST